MIMGWLFQQRNIGADSLKFLADTSAMDVFTNQTRESTKNSPFG